METRKKNVSGLLGIIEATFLSPTLDFPNLHELVPTLQDDSTVAGSSKDHYTIISVQLFQGNKEPSETGAFHKHQLIARLNFI